MTFIPTPNAALVVIDGTLHSKPISNTLWFIKPTAFSETNLEDLLLDVDSWWQTYVLPYISADYSTDEFRAYDMSDSAGPVSNLTAGNAGGAVGAALPGKDCALVTFRTGNRGRSGRGRIFLSGIREADVVGNSVDLTLRSNLLTAFQNLNGSITFTTGVQHVVVSFQKDGVTLSNGNAQIVTEYVARQGIKSQRDRS